MIILIIGHFLTSAKFHGTIKIMWKKANSMARIEIPQPVENWALVINNTQQINNSK